MPNPIAMDAPRLPIADSGIDFASTGGTSKGTMRLVVGRDTNNMLASGAGAGKPPRRKKKNEVSDLCAECG